MERVLLVRQYPAAHPAQAGEAPMRGHSRFDAVLSSAYRSSGYLPCQEYVEYYSIPTESVLL